MNLKKMNAIPTPTPTPNSKNLNFYENPKFHELTDLETLMRLSKWRKKFCGGLA